MVALVETINSKLLDFAILRAQAAVNGKEQFCNSPNLHGSQNLIFAFAYNVIVIPVAAGVPYPLFGILPGPVVAALAMSLSSVSVIANALRLRTAKL